MDSLRSIANPNISMENKKNHAIFNWNPWCQLLVKYIRILSVIWFNRNISYQQMTKVTASKEKVKQCICYSVKWDISHFWSLTLIPPLLFCHENVVSFINLLHISNALQTRFLFMEANKFNPDQTATKGAVWSGSILFAIKAILEDKQIRGENNKSHD